MCSSVQACEQIGKHWQKLTAFSQRKTHYRSENFIFALKNAFLPQLSAQPAVQLVPSDLRIRALPVLAPAGVSSWPGEVFAISRRKKNGKSDPKAVVKMNRTGPKANRKFDSSKGK